MTTIPDFTEAEYKRVSAWLSERYGKPVSIQLANISSGATAATLKDDDHHGPLMV